MKKLVLGILLAAAIPAFIPAWAQTPAPDTETVKVTAPVMTDAVVSGFVKTYTAPSVLTGKIPKWAKGICPKAQGLGQDLNDYVTQRMRAVAELVGAPLAKEPCELNVAVIFDRNPQSVLDDIAANHDELLGLHDVAQTKEIATVRHQVQAWYATETQDNNGITRIDNADHSPQCESVQTQNLMPLPGTLGSNYKALYSQTITDMERYCGKDNVTGLHTRDGLKSEFSAVTVVAARDALNYHEIGPLADYITLLTLSQTQSFDTCQKMETIANLLVPGCDVANKITSLTAGDIAFLKALYRADTGGTLVAEQAAITDEMKKTLGGK